MPENQTQDRATAQAPVHQPPLLQGRITELLAGKKIVLTGVTGFIGEQLLWKILTDVPDAKTALLVRPKGASSATDRVRGVLNKKIFADLVAQAGGVAELMADRVEVVEGDLPSVPKLPSDLDILIHCAGDVSFDPPLDKAFATNVTGTKALLARLREACSNEAGDLIKVPHYVHVSTAYTAGRRRGPIPEAEQEHDVDYRIEAAAAQAMREHVEARSRSSEQLTLLRKQAELQHRRAGFLTTAADIERRRQEWVDHEMVVAGTERARSLGWTDAYTFAKAMAERVVVEAGKDFRVSVVRPAIVESSLKDPFPGWIEGFKMADPIILAYGKGQLPEFPASPDAVIDIVPCDLVVNTIIAVAATKPEVGQPEFYHSNSGARNPLTFREIYEHVRGYFQQHPYSDGQAAADLPEWKFPGAEPLERKLWFAEKATRIGNQLLSYVPRSKRTLAFARNLDRTTRRLNFLNKYLTLYSEYLHSELHFVDDCTLALHRSLHPDDVAKFSFDTASFEWRHYMQEVHIPAITDPMKRLEASRKRRGQRARTFKAISETAPANAIAVFDLNGTIARTNVIEAYLWGKLRELGPIERLVELLRVAAQLPNYISAERKDRGVFLRRFYRRYAGANLRELERLVDEELATKILERTAPGALRRIREHRDAGHTTVLLTGEIRPLTRPFEGLFDHIIAADLVTDDNGVCTGFLAGPPMVGESRKAWLRHFAAQHGLSLDHSYAYADSHVDLPMLSAVGNPVIVNPDVALMREARKSGWSIIDWAEYEEATP